MGSSDQEQHPVEKIYPALPGPPPTIIMSPSRPDPSPLAVSHTLDVLLPESSGNTADIEQASQELPASLSPVVAVGEIKGKAIQQVLKDGEEEVIDDGAIVLPEENDGLSKDQPIDLVDSDDEEEEELVEEAEQEETESRISGLREVEAGPSRLPVPVHVPTARRRLLARPTIPTRSEIPQRTYDWERDVSDYGRPLSITPSRSAKLSKRKDRAIKSRRFDRKHERRRKVSEAVSKMKRFFIGPTRSEEKAYIAHGGKSGMKPRR